MAPDLPDHDGSSPRQGGRWGRLGSLPRSWCRTSPGPREAPSCQHVVACHAHGLPHPRCCYRPRWGSTSGRSLARDPALARRRPPATGSERPRSRGVHAGYGPPPNGTVRRDNWHWTVWSIIYVPPSRRTPLFTIVRVTRALMGPRRRLEGELGDDVLCRRLARG
jgi:hypothetical protein